MPRKKAAGSEDEARSMTEHLSEIRHRLLISLTFLLVATAASLFTSDKVLNLVISPFYKSGLKLSLNIFGVAESFMLQIKAAFIVAIFASFPFILFQIWQFVKPAIEKKSRGFYVRSILFSVFLFYAGAAFCFIFVIPFATKMLLGMTPLNMTNTINATDYFNFVFLFTISMGGAFELPVVVMLLTKAGIITPEFLIAKRKYIIVAIWIVAAILTPPDVISQSLMAVPLMFLYELSILISKMIVKGKIK